MTFVAHNIRHYRVIRELGKGGMGEVYLAEDTRLDRKVALKILPSEFASDAGRMARFIQEAKTASAVNHPGIITIRDDRLVFVLTDPMMDDLRTDRRFQDLSHRLGLPERR